jgi:ABC-type uncharacterized transport system auxiliary subunit
MVNNTMRIALMLALLFVLTGCESLGTIIHEKKYTMQIHETPNTKQSFGYNDDYNYVGFMVSGNFGKKN